MRLPFPQPPAIALRSIEVNGVFKTSKQTGQTWPYDEKNVVFRYTVLDFSNPVHNSYQYKLEGYDVDWSQLTNTPFVRYTNLAPGNYVFKVKGRNSEGAWSSNMISFNFLIRPPWWQSWWFILGIVICLGFTGGLIYRLRQETIARKKNEQQKRLDSLQMLSLQSQMNSHFIFNVLGSLQNLILNSKTQEANYYLVRLAKLIRSFLESSIQADYSKGYLTDQGISLQEELNLLNMYIEFERFQYKDQFEYHLEYDPTKITLENYLVPPMILQPYVENAIKYGIKFKGTKGNLWIRISRNPKDEGIQIQIQDDGVGIEKAKEKLANSGRWFKSRGRELTKGKIDLFKEMGYPIAVNTFSNNKGTIVTIKLG